MILFEAEDYIERLEADIDPELLAHPTHGPIAREVNKQRAEREWEMWLTVAEWELVGSVARGGESVQIVPDDLREHHSVMRWALSMLREHTDYDFKGIDISSGLGIFLKTEVPLGIEEKWTNEWSILGTMYLTNGDRMDGGLPIGTPIHQATEKDIENERVWYPDPDWRQILPRARRYLIETTTRQGPIVAVIDAAIDALKAAFDAIDEQRAQRQKDVVTN
jgi:hypothetical protein